jgi:hypothetical protein
MKISGVFRNSRNLYFLLEWKMRTSNVISGFRVKMRSSLLCVTSKRSEDLIGCDASIYGRT